MNSTSISPLSLSFFLTKYNLSSSLTVVVVVGWGGNRSGSLMSERYFFSDLIDRTLRNGGGERWSYRLKEGKKRKRKRGWLVGSRFEGRRNRRRTSFGMGGGLFPPTDIAVSRKSCQWWGMDGKGEREGGGDNALPGYRRGLGRLD